MTNKNVYKSWRIAFSMLLLFVPSCLYGQLSSISAISLSDIKKNNIIELLKSDDETVGNYSNLKASRAFLGTFEESADYGPMWYGDTIYVNQKGILITYDFDVIDSLADKSRVAYQSKDWHSTHNVFIPNDQSAIFEMYKCQFGGVPPSFGFANRRRKIIRG